MQSTFLDSTDFLENINTNKVDLINVNKLLPHEETEKLRTIKIAENLSNQKMLRHPIPCVKKNSKYIVLDGHHRLNALKVLGCKYAAIQEVDILELNLAHWYHCLNEGQWDFNFKKYEGHCNSDKLAIVNVSGEAQTIDLSVNCDNVYQSLWKLYSSYAEIGYERNIKPPNNSNANWIQYSGLKIMDVITMALNSNLLPPGITRFKLPYRILNLDVPIHILKTGDSEEWERHKYKLVNSQIYDVPVISVN